MAINHHKYQRDKILQMTHQIATLMKEKTNNRTDSQAGCWTDNKTEYQTDHKIGNSRGHTYHHPHHYNIMHLTCLPGKQHRYNTSRIWPLFKMALTFSSFSTDSIHIARHCECRVI